ncbi:MAG: imidazoleglycerol-phosphate dehydratase HisB [Christensenellales bacterium]
MNRSWEFERTTKETAIQIRVDLDGSGDYNVNTGIGFFDHMLCQLSRHGLIDLTVQAKGDLHVDAHHTVEDVGIALGTAVSKALGEKVGISRYANAFVPMDESLAQATIDVSGRPFLVFNTPDIEGEIGGMDWEMTEEFFRAFAFNAGITLHINVLYGSNRHHVCEAVFKAVARALRQAVAIDEKQKDIPSTKGVL